MAKADAPAVGIDLGTTRSVLAYTDQGGQATTIRNAEGDMTTPSVVFFDREGPVVGKEAASMAPYEPERVAQFAKRDMGESAYHKEICGMRFPPEVIQALILQKLKRDAELVLGEVRDAVITVPAYFNEPRRKATQDAGRLVGLGVLDIINEPTAAAIAFGVQEGYLTPKGEAKEHEKILVYDLGGGTFDVTLMEISGRDYRALATAGDVFLGGIDWDERIVDHVAAEFERQHGVQLLDDEAAKERLRSEAETAKIALTARSDYKLTMEHAGSRLRMRLTRDMFESLTLDLLERTLFTIRKVLRDASLGWDKITRILLVGGSSRMPMIGRALAEESGMEVDRSLSPDEAVAHGAAIYASVLSQAAKSRRADLKITNVNSHDLNVLAIEARTNLPRRKILIPRNTPLPAGGSGRFATRDDDQRAVVVNVVEGGDASGRNATHIGKCVVSDLPSGLPARTSVEVRFLYAENGRLKVEAWLPTANRQATMTIERAAGLAEDALAEWQERIASGEFLELVDFEDAESSADTLGEAGDVDDLRQEVAELFDGPAAEDVEEEVEEAEPGGAEDPDLEDFLRQLP